MAEEAIKIIGECEIAKLSLGPDDFLVLKLRQVISGELAERIRDHVRRVAPGVKLMIVDNDMDVSVLTSEQPAQLGALVKIAC